MAAIDPADIAAMRADGSLHEFLQFLTGRKPKPAPAQPAPEPELPRARPGAWPDGTQPPSPRPPMSPKAIQHGIDDYRAWIAAGRPVWDDTCHCPNCRPNGARQ